MPDWEELIKGLKSNLPSHLQINTPDSEVASEYLEVASRIKKLYIVQLEKYQENWILYRMSAALLKKEKCFFNTSHLSIRITTKENTVE